MDNNNGDERKHKKEQYHESVNFAMQQISENSQFSIAITVGIFGILAAFASINEHKKDFWENAILDSLIFHNSIITSICMYIILIFYLL